MIAFYSKYIEGILQIHIPYDMLTVAKSNNVAIKVLEIWQEKTKINQIYLCM